MKTSEILGWGVLVIIIVALGIYALVYTHPSLSLLTTTSTSTAAGTGSTGTGSTAADTGAVTFYCSQGNINATFSANAVQLDLADGRYFALPQVMSGSGIAYEATTSGKDELFQSEGSWAQLVENGTAIYSNCVAAHVSDAGGGYKDFIDQSNTFSFKYPNAFSIVGTAPGYTQSWMVDATTTGMLLAEVQLPSSALPKTNFGGADFTVGVSSDPSAISQCLTYNPGGTAAASNATVNGVDFVKFTSSEGAAGSVYYTTSYRIIRDNECYALEYTIHSTDIGNYPPGTVTQFNKTTVTNELDAIVQSFQFVQ